MKEGDYVQYRNGRSIYRVVRVITARPHGESAQYATIGPAGELGDRGAKSLVGAVDVQRLIRVQPSVVADLKDREHSRRCFS